MNARRTVLPSALHEVLAEVGAKLKHGDRIGSELDTALDLLASVSPAHITRAEAEIVAVTELDRWAPPPSLETLFRTTDHKQLLRTPKLEHLFLFHRNGRLREAALMKLSEGLPNPFLFAAVAWRLNDWAKPVRQAAARCARQCFPLTSPEVVARAAKALLTRQSNWRRWGEERELLDQAFARTDVAEHLFDMLIRDVTGPMPSVLRHALRTPALDPYLKRMAHEAVQPHVRAVALDALIEGRAEWPSGYGWQWIDKSIGLRRRVTTFGHRTLTVAIARSEMIAPGARDRSAAVRRVALDGVMRHLLGTPEGREHAALLAADRSASVRERAKFILREERHGPQRRADAVRGSDPLIKIERDGDA